jgi:hypothetical protein
MMAKQMGRMVASTVILDERGRQLRRPYWSISRSVCSNSAINPFMRCVVSTSGACRASARCLMILISS